MALKSVPFVKTCTTLVAPKLVFTRVERRVILVCVSSTELFVTVFALIFRTVVSHHMFSVVSYVSKPFFTHVTVMFELPCMQLHVFLKVAFCTKDSITFDTCRLFLKQPRFKVSTARRGICCHCLTKNTFMNIYIHLYTQLRIILQNIPVWNLREDENG